MWPYLALLGPHGFLMDQLSLKPKRRLPGKLDGSGRCFS